MSTKKLIRYLEETNAMFNQEDLKITHQIINDEVRILKLKSNKHIRISGKKRQGDLRQVSRDPLEWLHASGICRGWPNHALHQSWPSKLQNSTRQRYHRKHHYRLKHCQERSEAPKGQTVIPCPALAGGIFMLNLSHEAAFYDRLQRL